MGKDVGPAPWSFSRIKAFSTCPKQFYHVNVLKEFPYEETEAMRYGTEFHKAAEDFIRDGTPIPDRFGFARDALQVLADKPGEKICEQKLGLTAELEPCGFFDSNVWFRGIVDLLIIEDDVATIVDYKTSKSSRYAEKGQLELMALSIFRHYPQVKTIRAGLLFVIVNDLVKAKYEKSGQKDLWRKWIAEYARMEKAFDTGVWNPKPSGLCKRHCPVVECAHNGVN
jgi:CRISPR/Cas system-associated exonuclease Cas4 (RecB family)